MKKLLVLLLSMVLFVSSFGAKKLYVGTNAEFKPYEYLEGDKIVGFDIELMEAIAEELGYTVKWNNMSFDGLLPALQMGKIDAVIAGMGPTEERLKAVDFSKPYLNFQTGDAVVVNENETVIVKKENLDGKTVGVQLGTKQEEVSKKLGANIVRYDSFTGALMALKQNKINAVVVDAQVAENYLKNIKGVKITDTIFNDTPGESIAVKKGNKKLADEINKAFDAIVANGTYEKILVKYFPEKKLNK
ncbi:basic amino acid ABC transporter substrate-binding protein [Fusobacterium sp.]|uniref:basic amino acid ABC transporter substrate-binding protein n=1 Tax=Fusobacterium sp. TaxID=68766 RepID=UPI00261C6603|nr:basic amino acid ABC transporter substrate-binding protein [Fusobacterium sp.]